MVVMSSFKRKGRILVAKWSHEIKNLFHHGNVKFGRKGLCWSGEWCQSVKWRTVLCVCCAVVLVNDVSLWNEGLCCMCCAVVLVNDVSLWNEGLCSVCCTIVVVNDVSLWNEGLCSVCCTVVLVNDVGLWNEGLCCVCSRSTTRSLRECPVSSVTLSSANPPRAGKTPHRWWVAVHCWSFPTQPLHATHKTFSCVKWNVSI